MRTAFADKITRIKSTRKLLITLAVSTPIIFWIIGLLG